MWIEWKFALLMGSDPGTGKALLSAVSFVIEKSKVENDSSD